MIDMARKDNKGRNLKTGEYQRPDGRYEYRYKDEITRKRNSVYAADLASCEKWKRRSIRIWMICLLQTHQSRS